MVKSKDNKIALLDPKNDFCSLKVDNWVCHANALNAALNEKSTVLSIRFFSIYLSRLNPLDRTTREVSFTVEEYAKIMNIDRPNTNKLQKTSRDLLCIPITIQEPDGGFSTVTLYKKFRVRPENGVWRVTIDCHDDMEDYLFDLHDHYFKYKLWNMLRLKERNHQQMYKFLKERQFQKKPPEVLIENIKLALGLQNNQYTDWSEFRRCVLIPCQESLSQNTDLRFDFEPIRGRGKGGKIIGVRFKISENTEYIDQLTFDDFLAEQPDPEMDGEIDTIDLQFEPSEPISEPDPYDVRKSLDCLNGRRMTDLQVGRAISKATEMAKIKFCDDIDNPDFDFDKAVFTEIDDIVRYTCHQKDVKNPNAYFFSVLESLLKREKEEKKLNLPF